MGLFSKMINAVGDLAENVGLKDKIFCDICGEEIELTEKYKLSEGLLCKNCGKKISPWFTNAHKSNIDVIREHLSYREENQQAVSEFQTTRTIGGDWKKILLDENHRKFMVTSASNQASLQDENPDVFDFSQITGCELKIDESKSEVKIDVEEGDDLSYNPPQYEYDRDYYMEIYVNSPYFNTIRFKLNSSSVTLEPIIQTASVSQMRPMSQQGAAPAGRPMPQRGAAPAGRPMPQQGAAPAGRPMPQQGAAPAGRPMPQQGAVPASRPTPQTMHNAAPAGRPMPQQGAAPAGRPMPQQGAAPAAQPNTQVVRSYFEPSALAKNDEFCNMGKEIISILRGIQYDERSFAEAANVPVQAVTCPHCGGTTIPGANGCCDYCGGALY